MVPGKNRKIIVQENLIREIILKISRLTRYG